jgi:PKD repeat protein
VASATPTSGPAPLAVSFSGSGSSDPENGTLTYAWDLDGDGAYDDSTAVAPSFTYSTAGTVTAGLRVTDPGGLIDTDPITITVTTGGGGTSYAATVLGLGPIAYWRLGEASGTTAVDAVGPNPGIYEGAPQLGVAGLLTGDPDTAIRISDLDERVRVPHAAALNPTSQLSIAAWVNADVWTGRNPRIVQKGLTDNQYRLLAEFGNLRFGIAGLGTAVAALPTAGARHFVVGTYDGTALRLYVDNVLVASQAASGPIPTSSDPLTIGHKPGSVHPNDWFDGVIDDVSLHATALSAAQITSLWQAGTTGGG